MNKDITENVIVTVIFIIGIMIGWWIADYTYNCNKEIPPKTLISQSYDTLPVKMTCYQADVNQCDNSPNLTASGFNIKDKHYFKQGDSIGYCAVSRDLMNWYFNFGDTLIILSDDTIFNNKKFVIVDLMNQRYLRYIDILTYIPVSKKAKILIKK